MNNPILHFRESQKCRFQRLSIFQASAEWIYSTMCSHKLIIGSMCLIELTPCTHETSNCDFMSMKFLSFGERFHLYLWVNWPCIESKYSKVSLFKELNTWLIVELNGLKPYGLLHCRFGVCRYSASFNLTLMGRFISAVYRMTYQADCITNFCWIICHKEFHLRKLSVFIISSHLLDFYSELLFLTDIFIVFF